MHLDLIIEGLLSDVTPLEQASRPNRMTTLPKPFLLAKQINIIHIPLKLLKKQVAVWQKQRWHEEMKILITEVALIAAALPWVLRRGLERNIQKRNGMISALPCLAHLAKWVRGENEPFPSSPHLHWCSIRVPRKPQACHCVFCMVNVPHLIS